jgi:hypothetical protein
MLSSLLVQKIRYNAICVASLDIGAQSPLLRTFSGESVACASSANPRQRQLSRLPSRPAALLLRKVGQGGARSVTTLETESEADHANQTTRGIELKACT